MSSRTKGFSAAALSGLCFGLAPIFIQKASLEADVPNSFFLMCRMLFTALALSPFAVKKGKKEILPPHFFARMALAGSVTALTSLFLYSSYYFIPSGIGITIHFTYPFVVLLINRVLFKKHFGRMTLLLMVLCLGGTVLLCDASTLPDHAWPGLLLAGISSLFISSYFVWSDRSHFSSVNAIIYTAALSFFSFLVFLAYNIAADKLAAELTPTVILAALEAGAVTMLAFLMQVIALKHVGSFFTAILSTLEPIVCLLGSAFVLKDAISTRSFVGSGLVLSAMVLVTALREKNAKNA